MKRVRASPIASLHDPSAAQGEFTSAVGRTESWKFFSLGAWGVVVAIASFVGGALLYRVHSIGSLIAGFLCTVALYLIFALIAAGITRLRELRTAIGWLDPLWDEWRSAQSAREALLHSISQRDAQIHELETQARIWESQLRQVEGLVPLYHKILSQYEALVRTVVSGTSGSHQSRKETAPEEEAGHE